MLPASAVRIGTNGRQVSFSPASHFGAAGIILNGRPGSVVVGAILIWWFKSVKPKRGI
jgi:hypothetical protein